jgi:hypothetical protein
VHAAPNPTPVESPQGRSNAPATGKPSRPMRTMRPARRGLNAKALIKTCRPGCTVPVESVNCASDEGPEDCGADCARALTPRSEDRTVMRAVATRRFLRLGAVCRDSEDVECCFIRLPSLRWSRCEVKCMPQSVGETFAFVGYRTGRGDTPVRIADTCKNHSADVRVSAPTRWLGDAPGC